MITPDVVKMCFKICGLMLALDGGEDHAWCMRNFGEGYRELLHQQRVEWEAARPDATLPPLQLPMVPEGEAIGTNSITATELISRIPQTPLLLAGRHTGIGVWYKKLAVVVGGRMRLWSWRVATGRSCLPNHDGLSHTVSICGIAYFWGL